MTKKSKLLPSGNTDWELSELLISYKPIEVYPHQILSTIDAYQLIKRLWDTERLSLQEQFLALFFNRSQKLISYKLISTGTMNNCLVDIRLLVSLALLTLADSVIIAHNHPSGSLKVSCNDEALTAKIKGALALIDVRLHDHFIVTADGYISFGEEGLI